MLKVSERFKRLLGSASGRLSQLLVDVFLKDVLFCRLPLSKQREILVILFRDLLAQDADLLVDCWLYIHSLYVTINPPDPIAIQTK